jgi:hypothetical protein
MIRESEKRSLFGRGAASSRTPILNCKNPEASETLLNNFGLPFRVLSTATSFRGRKTMLPLVNPF